VPVQYLRVTDIDHARKIEEKLYCDLIRNILGHIPIRGDHLEFYIRIGVRNAGLSRRAHVATAFTAGFQNRITGCPGFFDDIDDLFQQNLFRDDDELFGWREGRQTATRLGLAAADRLGKPEEERYSHANRNGCTDSCGGTDVGGGIGRRNAGSQRGWA
jgi:hypothetical protein